MTAAASATKRQQFPAGFLWGAATSAYQIEGSPLADGAGPSIWHRFTPHARAWCATATPATSPATTTAACREDVALMRELGPHRLSLLDLLVARAAEGTRRGEPARPRLLPAGWSTQLRAAGIAPVATLYHWDLPAALDDRGGWLNADIAAWFADYAAVCVRALDDRVELLGDPQRALGGHRRRLPARRAGARPPQPLRSRRAPPTTCCTRTPQAVRALPRRRRGQRSASSSTSSPSTPASDAARTAPPRRAPTPT